LNQSTLYRPVYSILLSLITGIAAGALGYALLDTPATTAEKPAEPLYWVAPMDPTYRRDKPGKSPMGMDLIPVYPQGALSTGQQDVGLVRISPNIENNLGVRLTRVERRPLANEIRTVGYVQYNQDTLVHIHPRVEGWIEKLHVKSAGDPVTLGQPLYDLYSPELVNAQEEFLLALQRDNQTLVNAASERLQALQLPDSVIAALRRSRQVSSTTTFFAPQQGVIDNLEVREGFYVKPGTNLMSIGALEEVWVEAEVFERQASLVEANSPVVMTLAYLPGREWQGKIDYIYPTLDPVTRTLRLRLRFPNPDLDLKPNMFAQITILSDSPEARLIVPREAVIRTGLTERVVVALGDGQFRSTKVRMGRIGRDHIEILEGLTEGQTIVSSAQFLLDSESNKNADLNRLDQPVSTENHLPATKSASMRANSHHDHSMPAMESRPAVDHSMHQMDAGHDSHGSQQP